MNRIWHHWQEWECYKAGFFNTRPPYPMTPDEAKKEYAIFLADIPRFCNAMQMVLDRWPKSCDQNLSNLEINRIAWMGQAAMCMESGVPSHYRGGFKLLSLAQQKAANNAAAEYIKKWERMKSDEASKSIPVEMGTARLL